MFVADIAAYRLIHNVTTSTEINCLAMISRILEHKNRSLRAANEWDLFLRK